MKTLITYLVLLIAVMVAVIGMRVIEQTDIFRFDNVAIICETPYREIEPQVFTDNQVFIFNIEILDHCIVTDSSNVRRLHRNGVNVYNELSILVIVGSVAIYIGSIGLALVLIWTRKNESQ